ncbi:dTDP-4-dehydrorhamnose reductase [candidate division WOR-3 bacterium]|nr:dTDP-4-dehydrorhamnose reductase [candidate division WOR-3 bacterium]
MTKLLIVGSGLLGNNLAKIAINEFTAFTTYNEHPLDIEGCKSYHLNITNRADVTTLVQKLNPEYIIHTAALTNVDHCERDKRLAWNINVEGTKHVAEIAQKINAKFIYISTDYVFDGDTGMYKEDAPTKPVDFYGETKLEGEKAVKGLRDYIIVRPSVLYGGNPIKVNFVTWVIQELKKGKGINIVKDQLNTPTLADNLVELILELIERDETGIFHISGSERINRYNFAIKIAEIFNLNKDLIKPITSDQLNWIAKRPQDSSLDTSKISRIRRPLNIEEGLRRMRDLK